VLVLVLDTERLKSFEHEHEIVNEFVGNLYSIDLAQFHFFDQTEPPRPAAAACMRLQKSMGLTDDVVAGFIPA